MTAQVLRSQFAISNTTASHGFRTVLVGTNGTAPKTLCGAAMLDVAIAANLKELVHGG